MKRILMNLPLLIFIFSGIILQTNAWSLSEFCSDAYQRIVNIPWQAKTAIAATTSVIGYSVYKTITNNRAKKVQAQLEHEKHLKDQEISHWQYEYRKLSHKENDSMISSDKELAKKKKEEILSTIIDLSIKHTPRSIATIDQYRNIINVTNQSIKWLYLDIATEGITQDINELRYKIVSRIAMKKIGITDTYNEILPKDDKGAINYRDIDNDMQKQARRSLNQYISESIRIASDLFETQELVEQWAERNEVIDGINIFAAAGVVKNSIPLYIERMRGGCRVATVSKEIDKELERKEWADQLSAGA